MTISKKQLIDHLNNDIYCRIGISKISGVGVIAIKDIPINTNPYITLSNHNDKIITLYDNDIKNISNPVKTIINDFFGNNVYSSGHINKVYDILASGPNNINISFYMNHSDKPNISTIEVKGKPYLEFITNQYIKEGDELTINYNDYES